MSRISLTNSQDGLALVTPYDPAFVAALHGAVPQGKKAWDKPNRRWLIDPAYGRAVADLVYDFYGTRLAVPLPASNTPKPETRALRLDYLGRAKQRADGNSTASGYQPGDDRRAPSLVFPEDVLRTWFHAPKASSAVQDAPSATTPADPDTLYAVLGVAQEADASALKKARNRLALQWHPDHCREPNARAMFERIQAAYDLLRDPTKRKRYDAGLRLAATVAPAAARREAINQAVRARLDAMLDDADGYRAPERCGLIVVEGVQRLGRLVVSKILAWEEIKDSSGRVMVSSWPEGADYYETDWIWPNDL